MITPNGVTLKGVMDFTRIDSLFEPLQKPVKTDHKYNKIIELHGLHEYDFCWQKSILSTI